MATNNVHTYHCICTELILGTFSPLAGLPTRNSDGASICKISESQVQAPGCGVLSGSTIEGGAPSVLKLEDGFEKRYFLQCARCELKLAYKLDKSQFGEAGDGVREDVLYVLPGAVIDTEELRRARTEERNGGAGTG